MGQILGVDEDRESIANFAYLNYFQRPAGNKKSIKQLGVVSTDIDVADEVMRWFIGVHEPEMIVTVSRFAGDRVRRLARENELPFESVPQPHCSHWNKPAKVYRGMTGKQLFISFLKSKWIR